MANINHYRNKCIGGGMCYVLLPGLWSMSTKNEKATFINEILKKQTAVLSVGSALVEASKKVALACPVNIIKVNE